MSRRDDEELMAFLDGELAPRDARTVEGRIDASPDARAKVEALTELSTIVRGHYEHATAEVEPGMAAAWARLEAQLGDAPPEKAPAARADSSRQVPKTGFWQGLVDALTPGWSHVMTGAIGAAAGALLVAAVSRQPLPPVTVNVTPPLDLQSPPEVIAAIAEETQVDDLDVLSGTGMVFQVPGQSADKPATTVIWVTDDSPTEGPI